MQLTDHEATELPEMVLPKRLIPPFHEIPQYHWVRRYRSGPAIPLFWNPTWHSNGGEGWGSWAQPQREDQWEYCGPCRSPDQEKQ